MEIELHRCIDCEYCDVTNAVCIINNKEYNLQDSDLWTYGDCEFFVKRRNKNAVFFSNSTRT